jgi:hypothetical protein
MAAGDVDDAEPAHAKAEIAIDEMALVIGPAMDQAIALAGDNRLLDGTAAPSIPARNSAHASRAVGSERTEGE